LEKLEMKKTLVAIAALAAVGAASAQSTVNLFGRIDASIGSVKTTTTGATTADVGTQIRSGGHTGSRWGLRGSEDLGGGMKANFTLEQGFSIDTGADSTAGLGFSRQAFVGLSGGFGTVNVGRQYDIVDNMYGIHDAMGNGGYSAVAGIASGFGSTHGGAVGDTIVRQNNAVMYTTPSMGGFSATAMWAPEENKGLGISSGKAVGAMATFASGPFGFGLGYQSNKSTGAAPSVTQTLFGTSYDLGVAKLFAQYVTGKNKTAVAGAAYEDKGFNVGVQVPVGAMRLQAGYAKEDTDNRAGATVRENKAFGLMAQYDLSKRTYVYAGYRRLESDPAGASNTIKTTSYGLGVVHNF